MRASIDPPYLDGRINQSAPGCREMQKWAWWVAALAVACARELDPASCARRFDVQRDKIIRTEESREMGARYLSELDVGARDECLRLCCETDQCDVFVYEEKSPGSCYLFNCGPPEDFRCKFTQHGNFSSGVLALSRHLAELQDVERLQQHEQELANLRRVTSTTTRASSVLPTPTAAPAAASAPLEPARAPQKPPQPQQTPPRRCSRYQFECHTGGECVAVYNACDGIAQCADGSDEAPELGCPAPATPTHIPRPPPPAPAMPLFTPPKENPASGEAVSSETVEARVPSPRWPHRLVQAQPSSYAESSPHIFSHKGGLVQDTDSNSVVGGPPAQYPPFETPAQWQRRPWSHSDNERGMESMNVNSGVMGQRGWANANGDYPRYEWAAPDPRRAWPVPQPPPDQELPVYIPKTMPETPMAYSNQRETMRDGPKKGFDLLPKAPPAEPAVLPAQPAPPVAPPKQVAQPAVSAVENNKANKTAVQTTEDKPASKTPSSGSKKADEKTLSWQYHQLPEDEHDGLSESPPAAVLLLVLGILMTTVMAVILGCRLRAARRRFRRGKAPFAHDADYLVNGMYL